MTFAFIFQIDYENFIDQIRKWGVNAESLHRVLMEEFNDVITFYLPVPNSPLIYCTVVLKNQISNADLMNFNAISVPGRSLEFVEKEREKRNEDKATSGSLFFQSQFQRDVENQKKKLGKL